MGNERVRLLMLICLHQKKEGIIMKPFWRWLILVVGVAMLFLGIWFMFNPKLSLMAFTSFIGILLLINGIFMIVNYIAEHDNLTGWALAEGIITALLGTIVLVNEDMSMLSLTIMFGLWVIFSGVLKIRAAFTIKEIALSGWGWILALGTITMLFGLIALFNPMIGAIGIVILIGTFFVIQGINAITTFFFIGRLH